MTGRACWIGSRPGRIVFLKGWEARGADLEPHGNYYLIRDDTLVAAVKLGDTWLPASTDGSELVPVDPWA